MTTTASTAATAAAGAAAPEPVNPKGELGKNDFLKLMIAQLQAQNPLEPTKSTEYVSQLAQFSALEQTTNIAQAGAQSAVAQRISQAVGLIGHTVSYVDHAGGGIASGVVQSAEITSTGATLTIAGTAGIELSGVTEVS
jgi:flagellar basal-body rod modification protein FlgD